MDKSRTQKSIKNGKIALFYSVVSILVTFVFRRIFIDKLGVEILGLNSTVSNLLQLLNIAELGIASAISFTLYKPLSDKDNNTINEIISVQGWLYRRIGAFILVASIILMCFFPLIFEKSALPLWYSYASFAALLLGSVLGYFFNYRQIILTASQQDYKVLYVTKSVNIVKLILQIIAIYYFNNAYIWWVGIEIISSIVTTILLNVMIKNSFPELNTDVKQGRVLSDKYTVIIKKTKQLFIHKLGELALTQAQPLLIYFFTSLTLVANYGNYLIVTYGLQVLFGSLFSGIVAGIGNLVSKGDKSRIILVFEELFSVRFIVTSALTITMYYQLSPFVELWVGKDYVLSETTIVLILVTFFIGGIRSTVDGFIQAYGLYHDVQAALIETTLNISLSIYLGYYFGLNGVILGCIISLVVVVMCWKPYLLFRKGLDISPLRYAKNFIKHILIFAIIVFILYLLEIDFSFYLTGNNYLDFAINSIICFSLASFLMTSLLCLCSKGIRDFICRIKSTL